MGITALFTQQQGKQPCIPVNKKRNGAFSVPALPVITWDTWLMLHEAFCPSAALCTGAVALTRIACTALSSATLHNH